MTTFIEYSMFAMVAAWAATFVYALLKGDE